MFGGVSETGTGGIHMRMASDTVGSNPASVLCCHGRISVALGAVARARCCTAVADNASGTQEGCIPGRAGHSGSRWIADVTGHIGAVAVVRGTGGRYIGRNVCIRFCQGSKGYFGRAC